ncbi:MAG: IS982 family transposase [Chloroflexota bacterium]
MDALYIIYVYVQLDDTLKRMGHCDHHHARISTAEILTVAIVASRYFQNHHERALQVLYLTGYIPKISVSRFNRRLHQASDELMTLLDDMMTQRQVKTACVVDTMPLPVCNKGYAERCQLIPQVKGFVGFVAAKNMWFCGWRLHWICDAYGFPLGFDIVPAVWHELTTLQAITGNLPSAVTIYADGAYVSHLHGSLFAEDGLTFISKPHRNMKRTLSPEHEPILFHVRSKIEAMHSIFERMGMQRLHAVTQLGFGIKVYASLLTHALRITFDELILY